MTKKVLMIAAKANMIQQFNHRNIKILQELGYEVHVATNMTKFGSMSLDENNRFKNWMSENEVISHQIDFERRLGTIRSNIKAIGQLRQLFKVNNFTMIHVHSPLGGILGRIVAKQFGIPVIYTAHGFHFFKGSPKINWLVFFPVEWFFSFFTDVLVTINNEDFELAKRRLHAKNVFHINSNGIDVIQALTISDQEKKLIKKDFRERFNIPSNAFLISSVGELSVRKNHKLVLNALKLIKKDIRDNIFYVIAGVGKEKEELISIASEFGFESNLKLIGYQKNVHEINYASDVSILPSLREGLGIAGLDAVVDGVWLIGTKFGGVSDYLIHEENGWLIDPKDENELLLYINQIYNNRMIPKKSNHLLKFDSTYVDKIMKHVYQLAGKENL